VSLLPVLHIAPVAMLLGSTLTADRASMVPVALLLIGLGALACRVERRKVLAALGVCAAAWLLLSVLIIRVILPIWSNDTVLWSWTVSEMPECGVCHSNFARQLVFSGQEQLGLQEATLGLKLANQPWQFGMALGEQFQALRKLGRTDEALIAISKAVVAEPVPIIKLNYEMQQTDLLISTGRLKEAEALLNRVIARGDGNRVGVVTQLGMLALAGDRPDIARTLLDKASAARPSAMRNAIMAKTDDPARWTRMGDMYTAKNATAEAAAAYQEAARLRQQAASGSAMNKTPH
jgi:tetratricopeptide (TPR) repeat protein